MSAMEAFGTHDSHRYSIDQSRCIRCGAGASLVPSIIKLGKHRAYVVRQPMCPGEIDALDAAVALCPTGALQRVNGENDPDNEPR